MTMAPSVLVQTATQALVMYSEKIDSIPDPVIKQEHANAYRMLGAMMKYAPTTAGSDYIASSIEECGDNYGQLQRLGIMYRDNLILPFKTKGGKTPAVSSHASLDVLFERQDIAAVLESPMRDPYLRRAVLVRDNGRCLITGAYDIKRYKRDPAGADTTTLIMPVEAAHIIPFSLTKAENIVQSSAVWQIIHSFSDVVLSELNGQEINQLGNMITLWDTVHTLFGGLDVWLEPVDNETNAYYVRKVAPGVLPWVPSGHIVRFTSTSPNLALPNPKYIALHAACAKVAHASGAAAYIDSLCDEWEETSVLSGDGTSANMFQQRLHLAQILAH